MSLLNPTLLEEWIKPHSLEWYNQLGRQQGTYSYSWNSTILTPNGEAIFDEKVREMILYKKALDIGCGHGEFAITCSSIAKEIVGFDVTSHFIQQGSHTKPDNVSFVLGSTKEGFPFTQGEFDCAYIRKGPTSAYPQLKQIVKNGGRILGLHPGDNMDEELTNLFPSLFPPRLSADSTFKRIENRLMVSNLSKWDIELINSKEILHNPIDIIKKVCFGQPPSVMTKIVEANLAEITNIFRANETNGFSITNSYYIVDATV